jgi:hypothetical protein
MMKFNAGSRRALRMPPSQVRWQTSRRSIASFRLVVGPTWQQASPGVEQLTINTALSLVRGHLRVTIDKHQDGQSQTIQGQIDDFASRLASLVPTGATVRWVFEFPPIKDVPFGQEVECMVQGIVEGASADG